MLKSKNVYLEMENAKTENKRKIGLLANCSRYGLNLQNFIVDEFASLQLKLQKRAWWTLEIYLSNYLEGRALSCFKVALGMQTSHATVIPTIKRTVCPLLVLGNSGEQTFNVAFKKSW